MTQMPPPSTPSSPDEFSMPPNFGESDLGKRLRRQALKALAKTDIYAFGEFVFGYTPAPHHRLMIDFVMERIERGENGVVLAPRGSAKTTWPNTILNSFLVATRPDIRIGLFSQKDKKAEAMSNAVRYAVSESEPFRELFGDLRSPTKWTDGEWLRKGSRWAAACKPQRTMPSSISRASMAPLVRALANHGS